MKKYIIVPADKINHVDFNKVHQTSKDTLRYSLDKNFFLGIYCILNIQVVN